MSKTVYFVIGLGRFGSEFCARLAELNQYVVAIDKDKSKVEAIAPVVSYAACLDASDLDALREVGINQADVAVVGIGESIESSVLCCASLSEFGVPQIIARAQNNLHARVLSRVGATQVVFPERDLGRRLAEQVSNQWLAGFFPLGDKHAVAPLAPLPEMVGKPLVDLDFRNRYRVTLLLVKRGDEELFPGPDTVLTEDDLLYVTGPSDALRFWASELKKKEESR